MRIRAIPFLVTLMVTACASAQTDPILFTQQEGQNDNLFLLTEERGLQRITKHIRKDSSPIVSPDGKTIVFTSERVGWWKIWSMDVESGEVRQLTNSTSAEYAPCWSPDGEKIAFVSSRDGNSEIYVMDVDGSKARNITNNRADDESPFWGMDNRIYFAAEIGGVSQLISINPDGTAREALTNGGGNKYMPQVSPDGQKILYYGDAHGNPEIYTMDFDGGGVQRLTDNPLQDIRGRWSPDGSEIVFERGNKRNNQQLFVMNADGKAERQITTFGYNYSPSFVANCSVLCRDR